MLDLLFRCVYGSYENNTMVVAYEDLPSRGALGLIWRKLWSSDKEFVKEEGEKAIETPYPGG